jgi:hypothetical protein
VEIEHHRVHLVELGIHRGDRGGQICQQLALILHRHCFSVPSLDD